jgi:hypothetical protein
MTKQNSISRRTLLRGVAATTTFGLTPALAQNAANWPDHPVRLIVPYPAGGSTDVLFRIVAERLKDKLGQSFVVENKPGASGNIGIDQIAKGPADGYSIGGATVGHFSINQFLIAKMPYVAEKDLVAPSLVYELPNVAVVAAQHVPAKTLQEFVAWAKARPDGISIGSPGPGTAAPFGRAVRGTNRHQRRAGAIPRGCANHSGDAVRRRHLRGRQPCVLCFADRVGRDARARCHLGATLADHAGCADHGGGRRQGFRRDLVGRLRDGGRHPARHRRQAVSRAQGDCRR